MNPKLITSLVIVIVLIVGIFVYINIFQSRDFLGQELIFENISKKGYSGHDDRKDYVIKENSEWSNLWDIVYSKMEPKPDLPNIDFNNEMIIAVFQGMRSTGGYSIEIKKIIEKENSVEVFVKETSSPPLSMAPSVLTQPYHVVKTKRVDKEIIFRR